MTKIIFPDFDKKLEIAKKLIAFKVQESLKRKLTPAYGKDTGFLKANIFAKVDEDKIVIDMPYYAAYLEFGTSPHIIKPVHAKALHWKTDSGKDVFAQLVHHPGTRPFPFIRNTFNLELKDILIQSFKQAFN